MRRLSWGVVCLLLLAACDDEDDGGGGAADQGGDAADAGGETTADAAADSAGETADEPGEPETVVIAVSFPLSGPFEELPNSVLDAVVMAIEDQDSSACGGDYAIAYREYDHANEEGVWDAALAAEDAEAMVDAADVVAVVGTFNSGAAMQQIPILNEANLVMVSPSNTYTGLTRGDGADETEPDVYYPNDVRNYARVAGADHLQGRVGAQWAAALGATTAYLIDDGEAYGEGLAYHFGINAEDAGLTVSASATLSEETVMEDLADAVVASDPSLVYFAGITANSEGLFGALADAGYDGMLMAGDGLAEPGVVDLHGEDVEGLYITVAGLAPTELEGEAAAWAADYEERFGSAPEAYAAEGYAATQVILAAFERACAAGETLSDRDAVRAEVMATSAVETLIGSVTFDENGDITTPTFTGFRVVDGEITFAESLAVE